MRRPALALLLGCLLLVAGASALDGYDYYQTIEYAGCDQDIYQQDIVIHRTTGTAYNETAGGLETWHIYVGEHCREDYGDIRFTNSTGELAYYLWPDYTSSSARFTVRLEGADAAGEMAVWYGNAAATTTSDGTSTYLFFDDCEGSDPSDKWIEGAGTGTATYETDPYLGTKALKVSGDSKYVAGRMDTVASAIFEARIKQTGEYNSFFTAIGSTSAYTFYAFRPNYKSKAELYKFAAGTATLSTDTTGVSSTTWRRISMIPNPSTGKFAVYVDGTLKINTGYTTSYSGVIGARSGVGGASDIYLDQILVRAYSAAPPAALTFNGEQETAAPPLTAYTATPLAGLTPLTVTFTDTSTASPTAWAWSFGDGGTSSTQNPQHTYSAPGTYSVTLTATNEYGSTPATKLDYITVYGPITAQFSANITGGTAPVSVQFTDFSTGGPTSWLWSFGDGNTSTDQNPQHTYTVAGTHTVTLTASHPYDSDTETKTAYITVAVLQPFPGLSLTPTDLTGDGLYEDINGNGRSDYNDLTIFFLNLAWARDNEPTECFDFNQNGRLDYADVIALFQVIKNA